MSSDSKQYEVLANLTLRTVVIRDPDNTDAEGNPIEFWLMGENIAELQRALDAIARGANN